MSLTQFLAVLVARWKIAVAVFLLTVVTAVAVSLLLTKQYVASSSIVVDIGSPDPIAGSVFPAMMAANYMATQVEILESDRVALKVVRDMGLANNAEMRADWMSASEGQGSFEGWLAGMLQKRLEVKPSRESNVVSVSYKSPSAKFSTDVVNAFVNAYIATTLELRVDPAKQYSALFDQRAQQLRDKLEQAQTRLSSYQKEKGIVTSDERLDVENARLNELSTQLVLVQALSAESAGRQSLANGNGDSMQEVLSSPVLANLKADLAQKEGRLQELGSRLGENHPDVVQLKANIADARSRLASETRRVAGSVGVNNNVNQIREAQLRSALEQQRAKVIRLKEQRDEMALLQRDVDNADREFNAVSARSNQAALESQTNRTNVSVLTPAIEPSSPASPKLVLNTLLAAFVGILLALVVVLVVETMDRRVRSPEDLVRVLDLPVIGVLPAPTMLGRFGSNRPALMQKKVLARLPNQTPSKA